MIVGVDARELTGRPAGKGQYLRRLLENWDSPEHTLVLYIKTGTTLPTEMTSHRQVVEVSGIGPIWHWQVARRLKKDGVTHFFAALSYFSALVNPVPTVTVVHDLSIFKIPGLAHNQRSVWVERATLRGAVKKSAQIIAVSTSTKRDLLEMVPRVASKIQVIGEAALLQKVKKPIVRAERESYLLFVGTLEPRKNISCLLAAYRELPESLRQAHPLKLAGKPGWGGEDYPAMAEKLGIEGTVKFLGYVPDSDLLALYANAYVFIYPSLYEGFGLPVVEAMAAGTPVITSNTSSLPEVVGEAGYLISPTDSSALSAMIATLLTDEREWERLSLAGFQQAATFSWEKVSEEIWQLFQSTE